MSTTATENDSVYGEEWLESVSHHRVRTATAAPTPTQVDVDKSITEQDLKSLKKQDPFLYYSIPGVRDATVQLRRTDMHQVAKNGLKKCQSCPESMNASGSTSSSSEPPVVVKVQRRTRLSFERHPDLLLRDLILDNDNDNDTHDDTGNPQEDVLRPDDYLCTYLFKLV